MGKTEEKKALSAVRRACLLLCTLPFLLLTPQTAQACCGCISGDCNAAVDFINQAHEDIVTRTTTEFDNDLQEFQSWMIEVMFETQFVPAMAAMTNQMGAVAMQYTEIIGSFLDAQIQMDTQRTLRKLQFEAHKDYRPSEDFCAFGTNVRSLASSENKGRFNALALSQISMSRQLGTINTASADSISSDYKSRWNQFITNYCNPEDNNGQGEGTGLYFACDHDGSTSTTDDIGATDKDRFNRDINYTLLIEEPRTLNIDFTDNTLGENNSLNEEDIIALSRNLYGHKPLSRSLAQGRLNTSTAQKLYLALRAVAAKRSVAQASFNAIIGMKSAGTSQERPEISDSEDENPKDQQSQRFLSAIVKELIPANPTESASNIFNMIGNSPSYYAQLEILAKRIYQNPDFYADLYDSPANVSRKKVAMKAIELMTDRAIYESQLRREMNISVLLSTKLRPTHRTANAGLID